MPSVKPLMATVPVVEIGLRRSRIHADGGEEQLTLWEPTHCNLRTHVAVSMTPLQCYDIHVHLVSSSEIESFTNCQSHLNSGFMALCGFGSIPTLANASSSSVPLCITRVMSLPSPTSCSHPFSPGTVSMCSVHHQNTGSVSPSRSERPTKEQVPAPSVRHTWKPWRQM